MGAIMTIENDPSYNSQPDLYLEKGSEIKLVPYEVAVLTTPKMYTVTGTFYEAICFMNARYSQIYLITQGWDEAKKWWEFLNYFHEQHGSGLSRNARLIQYRSQFDSEIECCHAMSAMISEFYQHPPENTLEKSRLGLEGDESNSISGEMNDCNS